METIYKTSNKFGTEKISLFDPYVYKFIGTGNTSGIFQIESAGMQNLMKQMFADVSAKIYEIEKKHNCEGFRIITYKGKEKDNNKIEDIKRDFKADMEAMGKEFFERIIAAISLYRPGPMDYIPDYIAGMNDPVNIHYDTPELEPILKGTYGVIVYQEQVQQICRALAGYSLGRADLIRRAMGKKKESIMNQEREVFINGNKEHLKEGEAIVQGCVENGIIEEIAIKIWDKMADFAKYAFNKSHSAGYAVITVQTAWLKHYYPIDFMTGVLNSVILKAEKLKFYIADARNMGIKILSPNVNKSEKLYTIEDGCIRTGLMALRNIGKMANPIIEERHNNGPFENLEDFVNRLINEVNKRVLESLIYAGALDLFKGTRKAKINSVEQILKFTQKMKKGYFPEVWFDLPNVDSIYTNLCAVNFEEMPEFDTEYLLDKEYEYAGMFISGHPLDVYEELLSFNGSTKIIDILPEDVEFEDGTSEKTYSDYDEQYVMVAGIIRDLKQIVTKKGDKMYMCSIEDKTATLKCVIFPKTTHIFEHLLEEKKLIIFEGKINDNERGCQIIVEKVKEMSDISLTEVRKLYIDCSNELDIKELMDLLLSESGNVVVKIKTNKGWIQCKKRFNLNWTNYLKIKEKYPIVVR